MTFLIYWLNYRGQINELAPYKIQSPNFTFYENAQWDHHSMIIFRVKRVPFASILIQ